MIRWRLLAESLRTFGRSFSANLSKLLSLFSNWKIIGKLFYFENFKFSKFFLSYGGKVLVKLQYFWNVCHFSFLSFQGNSLGKTTFSKEKNLQFLSDLRFTFSDFEHNNSRIFSGKNLQGLSITHFTSQEEQFEKKPFFFKKILF